jgi:potassium-dependent mechanosensitive channel
MRTPAGWLGGVALSLSVVSMAGAEGQSAPAPGRAAGHDAERAEAPPAPIPVAEVMLRAEEVGAHLRTLDVQLPSDTQITRIESQLPALSGRLIQRFDHTRRTMESEPALGTVEGLADWWQSSRTDLGAWLDVLTTRAIWLDQQWQRLAVLDDTWSRTRLAYETAGAAAYLIERVDAVRSSLAVAQERVEMQQAATLRLQHSVGREVTRCQEVLALLGEARRRATSELFVRDSEPIWSAKVRTRASEVPGLIRASTEIQLGFLRRFVADHVDRIAFHAGFILALVVFFWRSGRRALEWRRMERPAASVAPVFEQPIASALVLGLPLGIWLYAEEPPVAVIFGEIATVIPAVVVLRRLVPAAVIPGLYGLAMFFLADRLRDLATVFPLLERGLFLAEMLVAAAALGWALWSGRIRDFLAIDEGSVLGCGRMVVASLAFGGFVIAFVAGAFGTMNLARLIGSGILASGYVALVLIAGRRLAEGLIAFTLRVRPFRLLRMVEHYRALLEHRAHVVLRALAMGVWAVATLQYLGLLAPVVDGGRRILAAELTHGALRISIGDVLAFAFTVYAAFLFSALARFVLEEDVFPRLRLRTGLPYALTSLLRYAIIFVGFVLALLVLGVNLDRVTVLGGAFGIGVGFGLQNVVNNFVSGLIVLFERPIRVGDAVQIGDVQGEVRRIGIRSSTVCTWEGAEVIVPNSMLVADKVTNWTPANRCRRLDVQVNVAYGTAPDKVLKVLAEVAQGHPDVAAEPAPQPLFLGFGDSALRFELRVWTDRLDRHVAIKSEVGIAVYAALREAGMTIPFPQQEIRVHREPSAR